MHLHSNIKMSRENNMKYALPKGVSLSQFFKMNSKKYHKIFPTNPTIAVDDEWRDEDIWDKLFQEEHEEL